MGLQIMILKMNMQQKCSRCLSIFTESNRPYKLTSCLHSICIKCKQQSLADAEDELICGFCSAPLIKNQIRCLQLDQEIILEQPEYSGSAIKQNEQECDVLLIDQDAELVENQQLEDLCEIHKIHMDIICISDKQRICPHCALFGNHKDHRFRRFEDFQKEIYQKIKIFESISQQKSSYERQVQANTQAILNYHINKRKTAIKDQINSIIGTFISQLNALKQNLLLNIEPIFSDFQRFIKEQPYYRKRQNSNNKLKKWEQQCSRTKSKLFEAKNLQQKLNIFYNSSLQLAAEGGVFLQEAKFINESVNEKIINKTNEIKILIDSQLVNLIKKSVRIQNYKTNFSAGESQLFFQQTEQNPFLDCTSSEIGITSISTLRNNSIEVDISNITNSCKIISPELTKTIKKTLSSKPQIKSLKSIDKKQSKIGGIGKIKTAQSPSRVPNIKNSRVSSTIINKSPSNNSIANNPSSKNLLPGFDVKSHQIKQPQKVYKQFSKNTLTDFFDISDCNLPNDKILEYVYRARKIHRIKGLKLASNHLNSQGFEKMIENLKGVGNINLANNQINENIFQILIKNRDRLDALKIINLSHNPINFQKKTYAKIEDLKKMGIIVIL